MKPLFWLLIGPAVVCHLATVARVAGQGAPEIAFKHDNYRIVITAGGAPLATYVYRDVKTPRPYFAHLHAPGGVQVTRNHPPIAGKDAVDHAEMHPGLWLAFGDLSSADNWRLKAPVLGDGLLEKLQGGAGKGGFVITNRYQANDGKKGVCHEVCRYTFFAKPAGYLILWDSKLYNNESDFTFGDQEEMGLGVRLATPLTVKAGGQILTSEGHKNEKQVRGKSSPWCDYSGTVAGKRVGVTLMQHPRNFRPAWYHARDYGLLVANPFGRKALTGGETSLVTVKRGETFRLRFGVFLHSRADDAKLDVGAPFQDYLNAAANEAGSKDR